MGKVTNWVSEFAAWLEVRKIVEPLSIAVNYVLKGELPSSGRIGACAQGILRRRNSKNTPRTSIHRNCRSGTLVRRKEVVYKRKRMIVNKRFIRT